MILKPNWGCQEDKTVAEAESLGLPAVPFAVLLGQGVGINDKHSQFVVIPISGNLDHRVTVFVAARNNADSLVVLLTPKR